MMFKGAKGGLGKLGHTLFLFSLPYICINLLKNVDLTLSPCESVLNSQLTSGRIPLCKIGRSGKIAVNFEFRIS